MPKVEVRMDKELVGKLDELARARGVSRSDVIREAVEMLLKLVELADVSPDEFDIAKALREKIDAGKEWQVIDKIVLVVKLEGRGPGCGYVYNWKEELEVLTGDAEVVELEKFEDSNCNWYTYLAVIPRSVPVVVAKTSIDEAPEVNNKLTIAVFNGKQWKTMTITWKV